MSMSVNGGDAASPGCALLQPQASGVGIEAEVRARAPGPRAASGDAGGVAPAASDPPWKSVPVRMGFVPDPSRLAAAARGWATAEGVAAAAARRASTSKKASPTRTPAAAPGPSATATELAFLGDKRITIEDKLFLFMALMEKKGNQELQQALTDYAQRREKAQAAERAKAEASASGGGGGFLGGLVDAVQGVVKQVGGPLLASAATAVGAPYLAPAALSFGGSLGADLVGTVADLAGIDHGKKKASAPRSPGSSAPSSGASAASPADEFDEKLEFAKIQRLYEKQQTMFTCLSNLMKAMHDTQMATVNNLR